MPKSNLLIVPLMMLVAACKPGGPIAKPGTRPPALNEMVETAGDWSLVDPMVGQTPSESGLLTRSPIAVDLNAMVGKDQIHQYRQRMIAAGRLARAGELMVAATPQSPDAAYLLIDERQKAIEAGWKKDGRWTVERTPATDIARPANVQALLAG